MSSLKLSSMLATWVMTSFFVLSLAVSTLNGGVAHAAARNFPATGELDCNGYSTVQKPVTPYLPCADLGGEYNEHYIGHDEPSTDFISSAPGSGNNVKWRIKLPKEHALPATQTFENQIAFWFSMALCDPNSFPQNPCIPDSDTNPPARFKNDPTTAGSAILELQFYPPGSAFRGCDTIHWCAAMTIDSVECTASLSCNPMCLEPVNFAFIQKDGIPTGPPGPASANISTFTPNAQTLLMNQGDTIELTLHDTPNGIINMVNDKTTGRSGFMVASAANGFQSLNVNTCAPTNFNFHPEFSTAKFGNFLPQFAGQFNIGFAVEIGHFEMADGDTDDVGCVSGPVLPGCLGEDFDFDGTSYQPDWPDGTSNNGTSLIISSDLGNGVGPISSPTGEYDYAHPYPSLMFETPVVATELLTGTCCSIPPTGATFYPFFAQSGFGAHCTFTFGNDIRAATVNDFGRDVQYGTVNFAWSPQPVLASGGVRPNPCIPHD